MTASERLYGTATVHLADVVADDLTGFLDRIAEYAFGPEDCDAAVGVEYQIVGFTAQTLTLEVSADRDPNVQD